MKKTNKKMSNANMILNYIGVEQVRKFLEDKGWTRDNAPYVEFDGEFNRKVYTFKVLKEGGIQYKENDSEEFKTVKVYDGVKIPSMLLSDDYRYYRIKINGEAISVHRLIMACFDEEFAEHPDRYDINHTVTYKNFEGYRYEKKNGAHIDMTNNSFYYLEKLPCSKDVSSNTTTYNQGHGKFVRSYGLDGVMVFAEDVSALKSNPEMVSKAYIYDNYVLPCISQVTLQAISSCVGEYIDEDSFIYLHTELCDKINTLNTLSAADKVRYTDAIKDIHNILMNHINHNRDIVENYHKRNGITYPVRFDCIK